MSKQTASGQKLTGAVEKLVRERFPEGLVRMLERRFPDAPDLMYEDAVADGVTSVLEAGAKREITNPRGYLTTAVINEMKRALRKAARDGLPENVDDEETDAEWFDEATSAFERPTEEQAVGRAVYDYVRGLVEQWESEKLRTTTLLVLEGAYLGEPLSAVELADRAGEILGEEVAEGTARQWRKRGLDRLQAQLASEGFPIEE